MADNAFPLDIAQLVALVMEAIFYGMYLVSFAACMRVLFSGAGIQSTVNKSMFAVALALGTVATMDFAFGFRHVLDAFIWYKGPGGAIAELENISYWVDIMKQATYVVQTVIADLMLLYRCYMVYDKRWLVVLGPLIIWFATLVCGCAVIYISAHLDVSTNVNNSHLIPFITSTLVLTLVQNITTTSLLAWRIWTIDRRISQYRSNSRGSKLRPLLRTIIESGAIYTLSALLFLITYLCSNNSQYAVSDCGVQIIGIVFNMIIIRVHEGRTAEQEATRGGTLSTGITSTLNSQPQSALSKAQTRSTTAGQYAMQPVQVSVARSVIRDDESAFEESNVKDDEQSWRAV